MNIERFPIEPVAAIAERQYKPHDNASHYGIPAILNQTTGVTPRAVAHWMKNGGILWWQADRIAIKLGRHPGTIWPEWWHPTNPQ